MTNTKKTITAVIAALMLAGTLSGCGTGNTQVKENTASSTQTPVSSVVSDDNTGSGTGSSSASTSSETVVTTANVTSNGAIDASDLFTNRDLEQTADLSEAVYYTVTDGQDVTLTTEGVYVFSGSASEVTIYVEAADEDKVQIVLDGVSITNQDFPCIYVKNADKVFVTTTDSSNTLKVTGTFTADGDTNTDAVIFSRDDLVLNGTGTLTVSSTDNGITTKDDMKITGGTIKISCTNNGLEANDNIAIADGVITISSKDDGIHAENDEDNTQGSVYICGGTIDITASDDGIHATTILQADGGTVTISAAEGLEATWVQINDGTVTIKSSDDGVNAAHKSTAYTTLFEMNGGALNVTMGNGDTDAIDSNGNIKITGGTINISGNSAFDYDGSCSWTGGEIYQNGSKLTTITNQMMGGGMGGNMGPGMGGMGRRP